MAKKKPIIYTHEDLEMQPSTDWLIQKTFNYIPTSDEDKLMLMNTDEYRANDQLFVEGEFDVEWGEFCNYDEEDELSKSIRERMWTINN